MASKDVELIDFNNDVVNENDTLYIHDVFNNSWKKIVAIEVDFSEREILVQYDDRSQEWVRMDGTKMCRSPPPPPPPSPPPTPRSLPIPVITLNQTLALEALNKKAERPKTNLKSISKAKTNVSKAKTNSKKSNTSQTKKVHKKLEDYINTAEDKHIATEQSKTPIKEYTVAPTPFPRLRLLPKSSVKMEQYRRKKEKSEKSKKKPSPTVDNHDTEALANTEGTTPISSKSSKSGSSKSAEGEKEVTKFKVRFGKAPDLNTSRKKGKTKRDNESFDDTNEEMSVVVNDEKLPPGWSKHMIKRKTSNKWDIVIQNEDEKKFRSRADLKSYFESINQPFPEELFDFSSGKRTPSSKVALEKRRSIPEVQCSTPVPPKPETPIVESEPVQLSIALAPFPTPTVTEPISPLVLPPITPLPPITSLPPVTSSSSGSGYICPKQDCKKHYRSENLLMMHIKHYHREYKSMLKSMPNVADLAYARTVGESIESPQSALLERIAKIEEDKIKEKIDEVQPNSIDEDFSLQIEPDDEDTLSISDKSANSTVQKSISSKKSTPVKKTISSPTPASPSSSPFTSVLLAQLKQPPLIPPKISIQQENTDAEFSVSQNTPLTLYSPKVQPIIKDENKSSPLSEIETDSGRKSPSPRKRRLSQLDAGEVINCTCGYGLEDGLMMQCDLCLCWQHGACNSVENEEDTPSPYICVICQNPRRIHSSKKFTYVQNWMKDGKIPRYEFSKTTDEVQKERETLIQRTHGLLCSLAELKNAVFGLQVKVHILKQTPDHPKLYLWAESWTNKKSEEKENLLVADCGPVPEAAINMADCRKHLSEHIDEELEKAEAMLQNIEEKIDDLEKDDDFEQDPEKLKSIAKHMLLMMLRDLSSIQNLKYCS